MKKLITLLLLATAFNAFSQDWPVRKLVMDKKAKQVVFTSIPAFTFVANRTLPQRGIYQELRLNASFKNQLMEQRPDAIQITVPLSSNKSITCELVKFSLGNIKLTENNDGIIENTKIPVTYRGIVTGEQNKNIVTLTVNEDYLGLTATTADRIIQVTKADEKNNSTYRVYNSAQVKFPAVSFDCGTNESAPAQTSLGIDLTGGNSPTAIQDKCVNVMVDCSDSMFLWCDSNRQKVVNYVYELFNSVATGYFNDTVNIQITTINVWTTASPFRAATRETALSQVAAYWQDNFFGNICVGLDFSINSTAGVGRSGLAGDIGRIKAVSTNTCPAYTATKSACCYCDMNYNVSVTGFPAGPNTTQPQVYLTMHEMGHLLGAHHTKWCGWKITTNTDTFGAIDSCGVIEGNCIQGPPPPAGGATIMSYCVTSNLNGNFVSYYNGFGRLPGNAIRNFIDQSACIMLCVDCFGLRNSKPADGYAYNSNEKPIIKNENGASGNNTPQTDNATGEPAILPNSQKARQ
jgi:hypothetical protein